VSRATCLCALSVPVVLSPFLSAAEPKPQRDADLFSLPLTESHPLRVEQAAELERYVHARRDDRAAFAALFKPDYTSPEAFVRSGERYRAALCEAIAYPPPGDIPRTSPRFERLGEDRLATYYRVTIPILPQVNAQGLYLVPKNVSGPRPLIISMHGGGGSPEVATFNGGANYHDMVRGGVKRGYVVFAPQHLFSSEGLPKEIRRQTDERLRLVGTTLTAIEIAKITRSLDVLLARPEVDAKRVAMIGLSYGGYYTQMTAALEPRIKVAAASCFFGVQEGRYATDELGVPTDFRWLNRFTFFRDEQVTAMICPRPLHIQAGSTDNASHREPGRALAPEVAAHYAKLGLADRFEHVVFEGKHEFHDASAWAFVEKHL
jgi:dienelactone hydrolase